MYALSRACIASILRTMFVDAWTPGHQRDNRATGVRAPMPQSSGERLGARTITAMTPY